jgi:zinc transport system ATP-binding protein
MHDVTIGYRERPVVRGANLTVSDGEVVAVLGANGSGKTTLVRGLLGLAEVMHGDIELGGRPVRSPRDRACIGYVPQRHTVGGAVPSTVREVVSSGRLARLGWLGRMRAADRRCVQDAIDAVQLTSFADADVSELSGGQQRRVLIARALAAEPNVLVMDEPTAGVDRASQQALADTIRSLAARGVPMIVVTHEAGPLADVFTRAVVVADGRITSDGPVNALAGWPRDGSDDHHHDEPPDGAGWLEQPMGGG